MKFLTIICLSLLVYTTFAKCGINYNYASYEKTKGGGSQHAGYGFAGVYLSNNRFCSDMEMLKQCEKAENIFNDFVNKLFDYYLINNRSSEYVKPIDIQLNCHDSIACYYNGIEHGDFWCENMDLYDKCLSVKTNFDNYVLTNIVDTQFISWKPTIYCKNNTHLERLIIFRLKDVKLLDNIPNNPQKLYSNNASTLFTYTTNMITSICLSFILLIM